MKKTPKPVDIEVGRKIRALRDLRGMTQTALGEHLGVTFQQVQKYEKGTNRVSASTLVEIARALNVRAADLLPEENEGEQPQALFGKLNERLNELNEQILEIVKLATAAQAGRS